MTIELEKSAKRKQESRQIVKEIINFGVKEDQKYDIIFNLALTLENNNALKEITTVLKKYMTTINTEAEEGNIKSKLIIE
jgi:RAB protein geranylgeranyltransferase component A